MEEVQYKLLKILQENPELSQRQIARQVGISLGKTNYCLKALIEKGWVKASRFRQSENKLAYVYLLTPRGIEEKFHATSFFLRRKIAEFKMLELEIEELRKEAGNERR